MGLCFSYHLPVKLDHILEDNIHFVSEGLAVFELAVILVQEIPEREDD